MEKINVAMVSKLMPYYRIGIFQSLSAVKDTYEFSFLGDTVESGGIKQIPYSYATAKGTDFIRWIKTKNYFYKPECLLWQTGIIKEIFRSKFKVFVFEGGIRHLPIWLYAFLCKLRGKKVIFWTHGNRGLDRGIRKMLRVVFFRWLGDALFLYGHTQRNIMIEDGYNPNRLFVVYNSLQPQKQFEIFEKLKSQDLTVPKSKLFKDPSAFTFIFIGRLAQGKSVLKILTVIKRLKDDGIETNCIFIGKGPEKPQMDTYCAENMLTEQIHFAGALYNESEIAPYFMMADLMVSPGNVGLNCIHSLAYGVPVLTHNDFKYQNPEVESISDGKTGVFFNYGDDQDLEKKLKKWIQTKPDKTTIQDSCQQVIKDVFNPEFEKDCMLTALNTILYDT